MGNSQSALQEHGYTLVSEQERMILVKNKEGDQFVIKKIYADKCRGRKKEEFLKILTELNHPHIILHKETFKDTDCMYLVLEHCEGGDLAQKIQSQIKRFSDKEILDWTVEICLALKYLHDKQILHKNLHPKSIFFTTHGTVRLGDFEEINERSTNEETAENKSFLYSAPELLNGRPYDEKTEIWHLGHVIYELYMLKSALSAWTQPEIIANKETRSYEALPKDVPEDIRMLVKETLKSNPDIRPSVNDILTMPFIIEHLWKKIKQTIEELYPRLQVLRELGDGLENMHFRTTVSSLAGGVVGMAGGITALVGAILAPFTLGASLIVTGVGIGVAVAGGATAGASNITNMVNQRSIRQNIKLIITEFQEKMASTVCCIQNISEALVYLQDKLKTSNDSSYSNAQFGASAGVRIGRGLVGIPELLRLIEVSSVGRIVAQTARVVRVAEALTAVFSAIFLAVDVFFIFLDSREIHNIRKARALRESQQQSENANTDTQQMTESEHRDTTDLLYTPANTIPDTQQSQEQDLRSETMKFVKVIRDTADQLQKSLDELRDIMGTHSKTPEKDNWDL